MSRSLPADPTTLITTLRQWVAEDPRTLADPEVKRWLGRRWRFFFLREAIHDDRALEDATRNSLLRKDKRPLTQRIAEAYLMGDAPREWSMELPPPPDPIKTDVSLLYAPGMLNGMVPVRAFKPAFEAFEQRTGMRVLRADLHPMASCEANAEDLRKAMEEGTGLDAAGDLIAPQDQQAPGDVLLLGYSKGMPDVLTYLAQDPSRAQRIRGVVSWAGANGGAYTADDLYPLIENLTFDGTKESLDALLKRVNPIVDLSRGALRRLDDYDPVGCMADIRTTTRAEFWEAHRAAFDQMNLPWFYAEGSVSPLEVPYFQLQGALSLSRRDRTNDMQLTQGQASLDLPMSCHLATLHAHHWDLAFAEFPTELRVGSSHLRNAFPCFASLMAHYHLFNELGLLDPR